MARRYGTLRVDCTLGMLPAQDGKMVDLTLIFIEIGTRVSALAVDAERCAVRVEDAGLQPRAIGYLEGSRRGAQGDAQAVFRIEDVFGVGEAVVLLGVVVHRVGT